MDAEPEITIRKLRENDHERLKFVVIATDGLWDKLSSEEVILLLSAHSARPIHPPIPKENLPSHFPQFEPGNIRPYPAEDLPDKNAAAHLIRNGLDGDGDEKVQEMILSLGGGAARSVRDDTSVIVVHFDTDRLPSDDH